MSHACFFSYIFGMNQWEKFIEIDLFERREWELHVVHIDFSSSSCGHFNNLAC
jgi:hypothetical protein